MNLLPERYRKKIKIVGECWIWTGAHTAGGYGTVKLDGRTQYVHRVVRVLLRGPFPGHLTLDHLIKDGPCTSRSCCNPEHNEPVTRAVNTMRGDGACAQNARKTECKHGHPFDAKNTGRTKEGWRYCRACCRDRKHASRTARTMLREQVLARRVPRR